MFKVIYKTFILVKSLNITSNITIQIIAEIFIELLVWLYIK